MSKKSRRSRSVLRLFPFERRTRRMNRTRPLQFTAEPVLEQLELRRMLRPDHPGLFDGTDGANPGGGLVMDAAGNSFGTTGLGGTSNAGTVSSWPRAAAP